jgi:ABC-type multidrug transport system ATPase subunit
VGLHAPNNFTGEVWKYNGSANNWTIIGGNYVNDSWGFYPFSRVESMVSGNGKLYVGMGATSSGKYGSAVVWQHDGTSWTRIGGGGKNGSWTGTFSPLTAYETINSMVMYAGKLYVGLGNSAGDAEVWGWEVVTPNTWTKVGGDGGVPVAVASSGTGNRAASANNDGITSWTTRTSAVGTSGAGKSTLVRLIMRLFDVSSGVITIDGTDIRTVTQESLREQIAFVPQDPVLFHRTLTENIRYGRRDASDAEVHEAARLAHCDEFIDRLPLGYDTYVGERGIKLSGGERQRIAIARAILKNAPILVLDEATSSLDSHSEVLIQDALRTLIQGKTTIVIAHRLSTIREMDRIVVMEHGKILEEGTHASLLRKRGSQYKKLWEIQASGFSKKEAAAVV